MSNKSQGRDLYEFAPKNVDHFVATFYYIMNFVSIFVDLSIWKYDCLLCIHRNNSMRQSTCTFYRFKY